MNALLLFLIAGVICLTLIPRTLSGDLSLPTVQPDGSSKGVSTGTPADAAKTVYNRAEAHLKIPKIGVDAVIKEMGVTSAGAMAVPSNRTDVGWFSLGTSPGETGSAVIGGHDRFGSGPGAFARLDELQKGDRISVVDAKGVSVFFVVRDIQTYDATDTNTGIFESESGVHLNLITCIGDVDPITKSSMKRLVVFTDAVQSSGGIAMVSD